MTYFQTAALRLNGIHSERIIGGTNTTIERYPYQVSLRKKNAGHICGGSIISRTRVLTAAHCLDAKHEPNAYTILAGSTRRTTDSAGQVRGVAKYVRHSGFSENTNENDVAVVHLKTELVYNRAVRAVTLAEPNTVPPYGALATITGWGFTIENTPSSLSEVLLFTTKPIVANGVCNRAYAGGITIRMLCAGAPEGGRDACTGDSGGPLVLNGIQQGISSWGFGCGRPKYPGVYTRVAYFAEWIKNA